MEGDLPQITSGVYEYTRSSACDDVLANEGNLVQHWGAVNHPAAMSSVGRIAATALNQFSQLAKLQPETEEIETYMPNQNQRRIVRVYIADANDNVPLDQCILYQSEENLTDLTDQELYFECPVATKLAEHNAKRTKWLDKEATKKAGKDVFLDPIKIRDLRMVVTTVAVFI